MENMEGSYQESGKNSNWDEKNYKYGEDRTKMKKIQEQKKNYKKK